VSKQDWIGFSAAGLAAWLAVTLFYMAFSGGLLESTFWFYVLNAFLAAGAMSSAFYAIGKLRHTAGRDLPPRIAAFVAPGLIGGVLVLSRYHDLVPAAATASQGRYGAFLLVSYAAVALQALELRMAAARAR
jgi:hypothetical protein